MAEEAKPAGPGMVRRIIVLAAVVIIPAVLGAVVFLFVVKPMLAEAPKVEHKKEAEEESHKEAEVVEFDEAQATVVSNDPNVPNPLLIYRFMALCKNKEVAEFVKERKGFFSARLSDLMRNRTRAELNDPYVQDSILKQAKLKCNAELKKFLPEEEDGILEVGYLKFTTYDL